MILQYIEGDYKSLPIENVEYSRIENNTYAPEFVIDNIQYSVISMMESYVTYGESNAHHILVADVITADKYYCAQHELTIDYTERKIIVKFVKEVKE